MCRGSKVPPWGVEAETGLGHDIGYGAVQQLHAALKHGLGGGMQLMLPLPLTDVRSPFPFSFVA